MRLILRRWLPLTAGLLLLSCTEATRSLGPISEPAKAPQLFDVERAAATGGDVVVAPDAQPVSLSRRVAVVIGNSNYASVPQLANPMHDAQAVANLLRNEGFLVIEGIDVTKQGFEKLLRDAVVAGGPDADILVFYAGHGFQIGSHNYLVPVDANLTSANDLPFQTVRLDSVFRILQDRANRNVSLLDACRNNPFPGEQAKTGITPATAPTEIGFSQPAVPEGGLVAYSTEPGAVAYDGDGRNSPFTTALLKNVRSDPTENITATLSRIRAEVRSATDGRQTPTWTSRLDGTFAFKPAVTQVASISPEEAAGPRVASAVSPDVASAPEAAPVPASATRPAATAVAPTENIVTAEAPMQDVVTVDAPMEKMVAVGARIAEALDVPDDATVTISAPAGGQVAAIEPNGRLSGAAGGVTGDRLGAVVYSAGPGQRPAPEHVEQAVETTMLTARIAEPGQPVQTVAVNLRLVPDGCDVAAGDWLDLQGVGIYHEGEISSPRQAVGACKAAVQREPNNGRFHYQLGRSYAAAGDLTRARNEYRRAAELGHLRAWKALGDLALASGERPEVAADYYRRGADGGDPLAIEALGIVTLKTATTTAEREKAYELIGFAMDLGLTKGMRALSEYFSDATSPGFDPGRADAFGRAAGASGAAAPASAPASSGDRGFGAPAGGDRGGGEGHGGEGYGGEGYGGGQSGEPSGDSTGL